MLKPTADTLIALIKRLHKAKGRYHTQIAVCDLFDAVGLPNHRPTKSTDEPIEAIAWQFGTQRGIEYSNAKIVEGTAYRCKACGSIYQDADQARNHAVFECKKAHIRKENP
jgi:hypothetical protein